VKQIRKGAEPRELRQHRLAGGRFADVQGETKWKQHLQEALLRDQGGLCCYCMTRISRTAMKVEHYLCQDDHPGRDLEYDNLFAACEGGTGLPREQQTCDTRKGNAALTICPSANIEPFLKYLGDGSIDSVNPDYRHDFAVTLNLNTDKLKRARRGVLDGLVAVLQRASKGEWKRLDLEEELRRWRSRDADGNFKPFSEVGVYFLEKQRRRRAG